jgi:hypothetical protein
MNEPLDHHGPLEGMCFLGLNFTHEQFNEISSAIVNRMDPKCEHGVEGAIVKVFAEVRRLRERIFDSEREIRRCADWYKDSSMAAIADDLAAALQPGGNT